VIAGGLRFAGGEPVPPPGPPTPRGPAVALTEADVAPALPPRFVAVTWQLSACPASPLATVYWLALAPPIAAPSRNHCTASDWGTDPDHVPVAHVITDPAWGVPDTAGAPVFAGGALNEPT
jgi:hypothetical protein